MSQNLFQKPASKNLLRISRLGSAEIGLLGLQFILGMILNLFVGLPSNGSLTGIPPVYAAVLLGHIIVAFALIAIGALLIVLGFQSKSKVAIVGSLIVLTGVAVAFAAGVIFLYDGQNNVYSFIMALGFLVSTVGVQRIRAIR
jgi:hypothetical protein